MKLITLATIAAITLTAPSFANENVVPVSKETKEITAELRDKALTNDSAYEILKSLTTEVGARHPGTPGEKAGIEWAVKKLTTLGFDKVYTEDVKMNGWVRGVETAEVLLPSYQKLVITALGRSKSTPKDGLEADIVHFKSYADLEKAVDGSLKGKIAFISNRMESFKNGAGYGSANIARSKGHELAAQKGAEALLIRSIGTDDHRNPHTGATSVAMGYTKVPAVALSNPDADQLVRLIGYGHTPKIRLNVQTKDLGPIVTKNVIGEITGSELPKEIVAIGAHLDSWDVGTGAIDDGMGVGMVMAAAHHISLLDKRPKRTIRVILFAAEEVGLLGAKQYMVDHKDEMKHHVLGAEWDFGLGRIYEMKTGVGAQGLNAVRELAQHLAPLGVSLAPMNNARAQSDMSLLSDAGMPSINFSPDGSRYFDYHHTSRDTFDKVNKRELELGSASMASIVYLMDKYLYNNETLKP